MDNILENDVPRFEDFLTIKVLRSQLEWKTEECERLLDQVLDLTIVNKQLTAQVKMLQADLKAFEDLLNPENA